MYSYLLFGLAAVDAVVFGWVLARWWQLRHPVLLLLALLVLPLPYDAAIVGAGRWIEEGPELALLSGPRFMLFNLSVPLIIVVVASLARLAGLRWAQPRWVIPGAGLLAAVFILSDWRSILFFPDLYPACWQDVLRYLPSVPSAQACRPGQPGLDLGMALPAAALVALPALVSTGAMIWWKRGWPWLFWGALAAFGFLGLPSGQVGPLPGFIGDVLNLVAMAATAVHFLRHPPPQRQGRYTL